MIKLFLVLSIISFNTFAAPLTLLEKHATSGYVLPEHSFKKDCKIFKEGYVESYTKSGDGTIMGFTHGVSSARIFEIRQMIRLARKAGIVDKGVRCDGGSETVTGSFAGKPVMIKALLDCHSWKERTGWAAKRLRNIAKDLCAF